MVHHRITLASDRALLSTPSTDEIAPSFTRKPAYLVGITQVVISTSPPSSPSWRRFPLSVRRPTAASASF